MYRYPYEQKIKRPKKVVIPPIEERIYWETTFNYEGFDGTEHWMSVNAETKEKSIEEAEKIQKSLLTHQRAKYNKAPSFDLNYRKVEIALNEMFRTQFQKMCDYYCKYPIECSCQEELKEHCKKCPLTNI